MSEHSFRMYCLVLKQLSSIQKGIQATHAVVKYASAYGDTEEYKQWSEFDQTLILLDGGTAPNLQEILSDLRDYSIKYASFEEPDLLNMTTAICFIVDRPIYEDEYYIGEYSSNYNAADQYLHDLLTYKHLAR